MSYELAQEAAQAVLGLTSHKPVVGIICGSGLGGISNCIKEADVIAYRDIPNFKQSTVQGHEGKLVIGRLGNTIVAAMSGRLHTYEGYDMQDTVFPVRVMHHMGIHTLIVTNAAGGLNPEYAVGDLMILNDHINFPGMAGLHPLKGPNDERYGPRFLALSDAYDQELRARAYATAKRLNISRSIHEGTYVYVSGPTYESRAEVRFLKTAGGDAVGMSTVPEIIVARHCGIKVLAMSLITNKCVDERPPSARDNAEAALSVGKAEHQEVIDAANSAAKDVESLVIEMLS